MKSTVEKLSVAEREALALFHDSPAHKAIEKLCALELKALGADALEAPDIEAVRRLQGQKAWILDFIKTLDIIYKQNGWYSPRLTHHLGKYQLCWPWKANLRRINGDKR